ncbi:MAG: pitrilysin family protein [Desulfomonilaceae bacterium]|nr:pitrilysin family protein [Desulfomonilaceae bacterium]
MSKQYDDASTYRKTILDNGIRIVTERVPYLRSVSLGIWVRSGSRFEIPELNGICHFIEHMLFKGTERRSALAIAQEIDSVGGVINAFTSKELTSFYCKVLSENLDLAADLLTDIFLNPSFPEEEIEREKQVICQEIHQMEDTPEDLIHEILGVRFWSDDPLGRPILGTIPSVSKMDRETMVQFKKDNYTTGESVICAAGDLDHDRVVELFAEKMKGLKNGSAPVPGPVPKSRGSSLVVAKDLEQVHICVGADGPSAVDDARHAGYILNTILGNGMSSRLFQEVREKRGLAYSVYSFLSSFSNTGMFGIYAGCDPNRVDELLATVGKETLGLAAGLTDKDIQTAKKQIKGNIILAMESTETRMNRLAKGEFFFNRYITLDEMIAALEAVTADQLHELAENTISSQGLTMVALGPVDESIDLLRPFTG